MSARTYQLLSVSLAGLGAFSYLWTQNFVHNQKTGGPQKEAAQVRALQRLAFEDSLADRVERGLIEQVDLCLVDLCLIVVYQH
jgi:hypothetical protein